MSSNTNNKEKLFLSFDIESDGPTPIVNNLLSIGIVGITMDEEIVFEYQANIEPLENRIQDIQCMQTFWLKPEQKIAWDFLQENKRNYIVVFAELGQKLKELSSKYNLKFVAHPSCFDWMFFKCYYELAKTNSQDEGCFYDIGFKCECSSTLWDYYKKSNKLTSIQSDKLFKYLGEFNESSNHMALSDARVQGKFYVKLLKKLSIS
jgi:hypothetical protein